jgi:hypothetical protein
MSKNLKKFTILLIAVALAIALANWLLPQTVEPGRDLVQIRRDCPVRTGQCFVIIHSPSEQAIINLIDQRSSVTFDSPKDNVPVYARGLNTNGTWTDKIDVNSDGYLPQNITKISFDAPDLAADETVIVRVIFTP